MPAFIKSSKDFFAGLLFLAIAAVFAYGVIELPIGTAFRMGPGYFPLVLALILVLLGIVVIVQAMRVAGEPLGAIAWRGIAFILPAPIFFGLTVRGLGFVPALFFTALIAAFASARMKPLPALVLAFAVTIFATAVFSYGLGLPYERFGPWTRF
jgi:hypothetical protein